MVIGPFVLILYGLICFGMLLAVKQSVTNAAAEGARAAIGAQPVGAETVDQAQMRVAAARVTGSLGWLGSHYVQARDVVVDVPAYCSGSSGPKCIHVKVTYPWTGNELIPPAPGLASITPSKIVSEARVQVSG